MYIKIVLIVFVLFSFSACVGEPSPDEFTYMRKAMKQKQDRMFANSRENLESRKNGNTYREVSVVNPDVELRRQKEAERKNWLAVGIEMDEAKDWIALKVLPKNAIRWKKTGLSYNTISVLIKEKVDPSEAISFMNQKFYKNPKVFGVFSEPLYSFASTCKKILNAKRKDLSIINKQCQDYTQLAEFSSISGYMADEYKDNDLALEYIAQLRQMDNQKAYLQKLMEKQLRKSMVQTNTKVYELIFPVVEKSPSREEIFFISKHKLNLKDSKRYKSYKYYKFWTDKEKKEEVERLSVIRQQKALKRTKEARIKAETHNTMVAAECGEIATPHPSTDENVHIEGKILHSIGKRGSNIFAYVIKSKKDGKKYLVRDPNSNRRVDTSQDVSWTAVTVGRVVSITVDEDGTATYNRYEDEAKEYLPMLKFTSKCAYNTED